MKAVMKREADMLDVLRFLTGGLKPLRKATRQIYKKLVKIHKLKSDVVIKQLNLSPK